MDRLYETDEDFAGEIFRDHGLAYPVTHIAVDLAIIAVVRLGERLCIELAQLDKIDIRLDHELERRPYPGT